jgi:ParB family chromosome partitioning protein
MIDEIRQIRVSAIDDSDLSFRISTGEAIDRLKASIDGVGLVCPLLLRQVGEKLAVVSGFRRLAACRSLGWPQVAARLVPDTADAWRCALWAVAENLGQRVLNPVEIGRALSLLRRTAPDEVCRHKALQALGLPGNPAAERRFTDLCSLPDAIQAAVAAGEVALPTAENLARLPPDTAERLCTLMVSLRLGLNRQRELLELVREIARGEGRPADEVLDAPAVAQILADAHGDRARRALALRQVLRRRRFPHLSRTEECFHALRRRLPLTEGADLCAPPDFEGRHYRLTLSFASRQDLRRHRDMLEALGRHPDLEPLLALGSTS